MGSFKETYKRTADVVAGDRILWHGEWQTVAATTGADPDRAFRFEGGAESTSISNSYQPRFVRVLKGGA